MAIRVAIVEDDPQLREAFRALVDHAADLTCVGASTEAPKQALASLPREQPQAVLMDIGLPGMTGIEAARRLKALLARHASRDADLVRESGARYSNRSRPAPPATC